MAIKCPELQLSGCPLRVQLGQKPEQKHRRDLAVQGFASYRLNVPVAVEGVLVTLPFERVGAFTPFSKHPSGGASDSQYPTLLVAGAKEKMPETGETGRSDGSGREDDSFQYVTSAWMRVQHRVLAYLSASLTDFHEAEDLLQEVATVVLTSHEKVDRDRPFTAWCIGIARNLLRNHYRKKAKSGVTLDEAFLDALADAAIRVDERVSDRQHALHECVARLSEKKSRVLRLRYEEDLAPDEIGKLVGLSKSNVVVTLHRIRRSLADCVTARLQRNC